MIVVIGEALVDLVIGLDGSVTAALGGAPYNAARAAARLGADVTFAGALSNDRFGERLAAQLHHDRVATLAASATDRPTTLAAAELNASGSATYRFYFDGTSAPDLHSEALATVLDADVVFTGGLALILRPLAETVSLCLSAVSSSTMIVVDVNARPALIADRAEYVARLRAVLGRADLVKVSDEDLVELAPDIDVTAMLAAGVRAIVVTAGAAPTQIILADEVRSVPVADLAAPIVDTIGAGDTFVGALLAAWTTAGFGREALAGDGALDRLAAAVHAGHQAAAIVVTRHGADPPTAADLA